MFRKLQAIIVCAALLLSSCRVREVRISPKRDAFKSMAGFASMRISSGQQSARSRFSFFFRLPGEGRIDVLDPLGRVHFQILVADRLSYFVLPSEKVFWQGMDTEILEKFLGFPLRLEEVIALLSGRWPDGAREENPDWQESWNLIRDRKGRIKSGNRADFHFQVDGYIALSPWVQTVVFVCGQREGRVKILDVHFNQTAAQDIFSNASLSGFTEVSWDEMEKLLNAQI